MMRRRLLTAATLALGIASPSLSSAQQGFALNRFEPSERGSDWFVGESLDLRGHLRPAAGMVLDYAHEPLVAYNRDGSEATAIVESQFFAHVGGALVMWDRVRFGLNVPVLVLGTANPAVTPQGNFDPNEGLALGDPRLGADVRLLGVYGSPYTVAAGVQVFVPSGSRDSYVSDGTLRLRPRVMAAGDVGRFTYAGQLGLHVRPHTADFADTRLGSELSFAASAGVRLFDRALTVGPELSGATLLGSSSTPLELLFGGKYTFAKDFRIGLGGGPGLTQGLGAPEYRVVASFEWFPDFDEAGDRDSDGVQDLDDRCPNRAAGPKPDPARPGCPARDSDSDGFADHEDACPLESGIARPDKPGCPPDPPPPPPPDSDNDGIVDAEDACPKEPGVSQADRAKNGCPRVRLEKETKQIRIIQRIEFEYDEAALTAGSHHVLEDVRDVLATHPEITLIEIQGHTDNVGSESYNVKLSEARARIVLQWLVDHGIDAGRLRAVGFGKSKPLDTNDTELGRQQNRRVEFHILEQQTEAHSPDSPSDEASDESGEDGADTQGAGEQTPTSGDSAAPSE